MCTSIYTVTAVYMQLFQKRMSKDLMSYIYIYVLYMF